MKNISVLLIGLFCTVTAYCQDEEFKIYPNGLIYSEQTMGKLSHIVDSLNLKYKNCDFNTVFYSKSQIIGYVVRVEEMNVLEAKKDMEDQMPFDDFLKKYPNASVERDVIILKSIYKNHDDQDVVEFEEFDLISDYSFSISSVDSSLFHKDLSNTWLLEYFEKTDHLGEWLRAFYFPENFSSVPIPQKYAEMIGYADCLIDTTTAKFKDNLKGGRTDLPENWTSLSIEEKAILLDELRGTRVVGTCSHDSSPREHAIHIALLSAETYNWEVFLKAHLDIMNDRFARMSDASSSWGERNTYIKELEELNINVTDLILGISFRIENPASNHYYSSIGRVGRALAETTNRTEIEQAMLSIITDNELDLYNRVLFYYLFLNYNYYLVDEIIKKENDDKLAEALKTMPDFVVAKLTID